MKAITSSCIQKFEIQLITFELTFFSCRPFAQGVQDQQGMGHSVMVALFCGKLFLDFNWIL